MPVQVILLMHLLHNLSQNHAFFNQPPPPKRWEKPWEVSRAMQRKQSHGHLPQNRPGQPSDPLCNWCNHTSPQNTPSAQLTRINITEPYLQPFSQLPIHRYLLLNLILKEGKKSINLRLLSRGPKLKGTDNHFSVMYFFSFELLCINCTLTLCTIYSLVEQSPIYFQWVQPFCSTGIKPCSFQQLLCTLLLCFDLQTKMRNSSLTFTMFCMHSFIWKEKWRLSWQYFHISKLMDVRNWDSSVNSSLNKYKPSLLIAK